MCAHVFVHDRAGKETDIHWQISSPTCSKTEALLVCVMICREGHRGWEKTVGIMSEVGCEQFMENYTLGP